MNNPGNRAPTRASLRQLLESVLKLDEHFDGFCGDHFPDVAREITAGMLRSAKLNVLLDLRRADEILAALSKANGDKVKQYEDCLEWEEGQAGGQSYRGHESRANSALYVPPSEASSVLFGARLARPDAGGRLLSDNALSPELINDVFFDIYYPQHEPYYVRRGLDTEIERTVDFFSIWLYGPSGYGKTSAIRRQILRSNSRLVGVFLASAVNCTARELMAALYVELCDALHEPLGQHPQQWSSAVAKDMSELLNRHARVQANPLSIYVDEVPVDSSAVYAEFVRLFVAYLIVYSSKYPPPHPRYVLSSIHSPIEHIGMSQQKIRERLRIVRVDAWAEAEMQQLLAIACQRLGIVVARRVQELFLAAAEGSPRMLKSFLKRMAMTGRSVSDPEEIIALERIAHGLGGR